MNSPDPEARYNKHRGIGCFVQIMETFAEDDALPEAADSPPPKPDLITHVAVGPLTMHDPDALNPALENTAGRRRPTQRITRRLALRLRRQPEAGTRAWRGNRFSLDARQGEVAKANSRWRILSWTIRGAIPALSAGHAPVETSVADIRLRCVPELIRSSDPIESAKFGEARIKNPG